MERRPQPSETIDLTSDFGTTPVLASGPREAPPVVLLHAYQATSAEWNELAGLLRSDHRVFAVDLVFDAGCSVSGRRSVASVDDLVSYLDPVLTGLGVTSPEPVGHSLGA